MLSLAESLASLPTAQRNKLLAGLDEKTHAYLQTEWRLWARPDQMLPAGAWTFWLILAGRGWGKTRTGAETVRAWAKTSRFVNLIGATADDARDIMIEGESGILAICPKGERPEYKKNDRKLIWPSGAISLIFTADEPDRLRGKQHEKLWCDELAAWRYPDSWDQAMFGLRLGSNPQAVVTTTPRPVKMVRSLVSDPDTYLTRGKTQDNRRNLAEKFVRTIIAKYEGTRLGRQELDGAILDDVPGALWARDQIDAHRRKAHDYPVLRRIVVAVDPPATSGEKADECGIVVAGLGEDGRGYVLADCTTQGQTPEQWAQEVVKAARAYDADRVVAEVNNGGEMVEAVLRQVAPNLPYRAVRASKGKFTRAEPISALYEQGRISHCGSFARLEDQMCEFTQDFDAKAMGYSPDRVDALVWVFTELMLGPRGPSTHQLRM